jgi:hypothetical protein
MPTAGRDVKDMCSHTKCKLVWSWRTNHYVVMVKHQGGVEKKGSQHSCRQMFSSHTCKCYCSGPAYSSPADDPASAPALGNASPCEQLATQAARAACERNAQMLALEDRGD